MDAPWGFGTTVLLAVFLRTQVIAREERYLALKFGQEYAGYSRRVRRWI